MGEITKIEVQKKNKQRANVFIDGEFVCGLSCETVVLRRLKPGSEISSADLKDAVTEDEKKRALTDLFKVLSRKRLTEKQAKEYLEKKIYIPEAIEYAAERGKEYGYINDADYAAQYISVYGQKSGVLKLKHDLQGKGVDKNIIADLLDGADDAQVAFRLLEKHLKGGSITDMKTKNKAMRFLLSKGCTYASVKAAFEKISADSDGEFDEENGDY
ncbi:MAG: RecX family transcriptional regulator [Clostridiales bacterium]|jgi:regulatory protein|nr:RecX family transcriptional regulator [Clostridiales bacterium]